MNRDPVEDALEAEDPAALARAATAEDLARMKAAEELVELRAQRRRRRSRFAVASQVLVGWVALAGFFVNAWQIYANKRQQEQQARSDQEKWAKEFARASQADKYRAFFETSALATDPTNTDKRLVGYALLQEFVQDRDYSQKAMLMLEESLVQELRSNTEEGLDERHAAAVMAIVTALAESNDCHSLQKAARSVDRVARRHAEVQDPVETGEILKVYIRRIIGRAAQVCTSFKDFKEVRRPVRDTIAKNPEVLGLRGRPSVAEVNARMGEVLRDACADENAVSGATDCPDVLRAYAALCTHLDPKEEAENAANCALMKGAAAALPPPAPVAQ